MCPANTEADRPRPNSRWLERARRDTMHSGGARFQVARFLLPEQHRPAPADNVFIVASAYHLILAHILARAADIAPGTSVLLMKHQPVTHFRELFDAVRADSGIPFREVFFLDRPGTKYKRRWRAMIDFTRIRGMKAVLAAARPKRLFVFNEDDLNQYASRWVKSRGGDVYAVEDGAIAYTDQLLTATPSERMKSKLFFGPRTEAVTVEGSSRRIDRYYARFPSHLRSELNGRAAAIPESDLDFFENLRWPKDFMRRLGVNPETLWFDDLFLLAHSKNFKDVPEYRDGVRHLVAQLAEQGRKVAVSYHPRERDADWLDLQALGTTLIPHAVPSEFIHLFSRRRLGAVYGDIGTALITAKWVLKSVPIVSLMDTLNVADPPLRALFEALGIEVR